MKGRTLKEMGAIVFLLGTLLVLTYHVPNCSGIACRAVFPVLELSSYHIKNGEDVHAYVLAFEGPCDKDVYEVISENGHVLFRREGSIYVADTMRYFDVFYVPGCRGNLTLHAVGTYFSNVAPPNLTYDGNYFVFLDNYSLGLSAFYIETSGLIGANVSDWFNIFYVPAFNEVKASYANGTLQTDDILYSRTLAGIRVFSGAKVSSFVVYDDPDAYFEFKNCTEHYREIVEACRASGSPEYQLPLGLGLMLAGIALFTYGMKF
ncbi:hypothetical protein [Thermococcus sp.]|uniref:hypothetical protein n=1 Tax=Thermococcus sp. TaxID=35749 RepID=UPI002621AA8E|nr:hypothetical protein [Thermococcus sp.]